MSNDPSNPNDPLGFVRNMWGNMGFSLPGMVAPTFDVDELEKRIKDLKAVEGWLRMNLSMLQATIQGLEMQATTLTAVKAMGSMATNAAQQAAHSASQPAPQHEAPAAAPPAFDPAGLGMSPEAAGALSQAAMWPWHLMQQMQEQLQQQADNAKAKTAAAKAKESAAKPGAKKAAAPRRTPRKPAA